MSSDKQKTLHVSQGLFRSSYKTINSFNGISLLFQKVGFSKNPSNPKDFKNKYKTKTKKSWDLTLLSFTNRVFDY